MWVFRNLSMYISMCHIDTYCKQMAAYVHSSHAWCLCCFCVSFHACPMWRSTGGNHIFLMIIPYVPVSGGCCLLLWIPCLFTIGTGPCRLPVHGIFCFFLRSWSDTAHRTRRVLAGLAAKGSSFTERLYHFLLIGEWSVRPLATDSACRTFAELALHCFRVVTLLASYRKVVC